MKRVLGFVLFAFLGGCTATAFTGSPHVENGRGGCEAKCSGQGMQVAGMVYMGEYSSACVCSVPGQTGQAQYRMLSAAAVGAGVAGVEMQQRRQQQQQQQQSHQY